MEMKERIYLSTIGIILLCTIMISGCTPQRTMIIEKTEVLNVDLSTYTQKQLSEEITGNWTFYGSITVVNASIIDTNKELILKNGTTSVIVLNNSGNNYVMSGKLGVGTTGPNGTVHIVGAAVGTGIAPLIVQNTEAYANPFTQYSQIWLGSSGTVMASMRNDGTFVMGGTQGYIKGKNYFATSNGAATLAVFSSDADVNTGMYFPAADTLGFTTGGIETLRIMNTSSVGMVGIGTQNPSSSLHVVSNYNGKNINIQRTNTSQNNGLQFSDQAGGAQAQIRLEGYTTNDLQIMTNAGTNNNIRFYTESNLANNASPTGERMIITNAGNVGIGTNSPTQKLDVNGTIQSNNIFRNSQGMLLQTTTGLVHLYQAGGVSLDYWSGSAVIQGLVLNNNGNVGIGTNLPTQKLDVNGSVNITNKLYLPGIDGNGTFICYNVTDSSIYRSEVACA